MNDQDDNSLEDFVGRLTQEVEEMVWEAFSLDPDSAIPPEIVSRKVVSHVLRACGLHFPDRHRSS